MQITLNSDHTVTLVLDRAELASVNDALDVRKTLATFPKAPADRLNAADRGLVGALERATYEAYEALEDQIMSEQDEPGTNHVPEPSLGEMLFQSMVNMTEAYAAGLREGSK